MANDTRLHGKIATIAEAGAYHVARLGGACGCCGETTAEFLEVCPAPGSPVFSSGFDNPGAFYGFLDRYAETVPAEVRCANCWHARARHDICPHEKAAVSLDARLLGALAEVAALPPDRRLQYVASIAEYLALPRIADPGPLSL